MVVLCSRLWLWGCLCTAKVVKGKWGSTSLKWKAIINSITDLPLFDFDSWQDFYSSIHYNCLIWIVTKSMNVLCAGVTSFSIDFAMKKVTVVGDITPLGVLASISRVKNARFWPSLSSSSPLKSTCSYSWVCCNSLVRNKICREWWWITISVTKSFSLVNISIIWN